jgi:hypothetical protein
MADQKKQSDGGGAGVSPAEDMYGRPTTAQGEPTRGLPAAHGTSAPREAGASEDEETENPRGRSGEERDPNEAMNAIPDGDGPRSDRGTNPLPDSYWSAHPDRDKR